MSKLLKVLTGVKVKDYVAKIFDYGVENHHDLFMEYQGNLVLAGKVAELSVAQPNDDGEIVTVTGYDALDPVMQDEADLYPNGFGFQIQKSSGTDFFMKFVIGVVSAEMSELNRTRNGLDPEDEDYGEMVTDIDSNIRAYAEIKKELGELITELPGNGLAGYLKKKSGYIAIEGNEEGNVIIRVSRKPIIDDKDSDDYNPGEVVLKTTNGNSCDAPFSGHGELRGFDAVAKNLNSDHFVICHPEGDTLFLWESWAKKSKIKFNETEWGQLYK